MRIERRRPAGALALALALVIARENASAQTPSPAPSPVAAATSASGAAPAAPAAPGAPAAGRGGAPPAPSPTAPPTPTLDMTDALTNDADFLKSAGKAAQAAMDANDAADLAARIANDFANLQQIVGKIHGDALNGPLGDIPQIPPDRPDPDASPGSDTGSAAAAGDLSNGITKSSSDAARIDAQLPATAPDMKTCAGLRAAHDDLARAAALVDEAGGAPIEAVLDYIKAVSTRPAVGGGARIDAAVSAKLATELSQGLNVKNDLDEALLVDASNAANDELDKTCGSLTGPFDETMIAHFYAKDGGEWWTYSTHVRGTLSVSYARTDTGASIPVTGTFAGDADAFSYATDPYVHLSLTKGAIVNKVDTAPIPDPGGATSFEIPVTGTLAGSSLLLTLGNAISDFDPQYVLGKTKALIASPLAIGPVRNHYELPYKDVHFMLQHFFRGTPWQVTTNGSSREVVFSGTLDRPGAQNDAKYALDVHACDPACTQQ